jgi:hypothetical protein
MYDMKNSTMFKVAKNIAAITSNTTTAGNIIDTKGFESLTFVAQTGAYSNGLYTAKVETGNESNLSDAVDITATGLIGSDLTVSAANVAISLGVTNFNRYARLSFVSTGVTSAGATLNGLAMLGHPKSAPVEE